MTRTEMHPGKHAQALALSIGRISPLWEQKAFSESVDESGSGLADGDQCCAGGHAMSELMERAFDDLNYCMQATYRVLTEQSQIAGSEQERRQRALAGIQETLEGKPLATFKAEHLEFLELLFAYWRELEVEAGAPEPDGLQ
jgi:hypothetical protein